MDLTINKLQRLICHKTQTKQNKILTLLTRRPNDVMAYVPNCDIGVSEFKRQCTFGQILRTKV